MWKYHLSYPTSPSLTFTPVMFDGSCLLLIVLHNAFHQTTRGGQAQFHYTQKQSKKFSSNLGNDLHFLLKWLRLIIFRLKRSGGVLHVHPRRIGLTHCTSVHLRTTSTDRTDKRTSVGVEVGHAERCRNNLVTLCSWTYSFPDGHVKRSGQ